MSTDQSADSFSRGDIERALRRNEFLLVYQPIVSAQTARTIGIEALLRLKLPNGDLAFPDEFIGLAENTGLVDGIGDWALRRACRDGLRWPSLRVAVNISPKQLQHSGFAERVRDILSETGFPAERLELELTEHCPLTDVAQAQSNMAALRRTGVRLALDDFGAGYSGLIYLRRLPLDKIKIDRAFIESVETREADILVRSIISLGRQLGLTVTAEGVEAAEHQAYLADAGCDELQGYLFSRPLPASDVDTLFGAGGASTRLRMAGAA
ncbi:MAG: EAL domain-containing protein [Beijerinckiaceae bacterium]